MTAHALDYAICATDGPARRRRSPAPARCLRLARAVSRRARRTRRTRTASALDPVERHARDARAAGAVVGSRRRTSTACCPSTLPASTSRRRRFTDSPSIGCSSRRATSRSCRRTAGTPRVRRLRLHDVLDQPHWLSRRASCAGAGFHRGLAGAHRTDRSANGHFALMASLIALPGRGAALARQRATLSRIAAIAAGRGKLRR